jgi:hypothetical protein
MDNEIKILFKKMAGLINMPTESEFDAETHNYKNEFLHMNFNSFYGGYRIEIVDKSTGERDFGTSQRKTKKEMIEFLQGFITGITYKAGQ